MRNKLLIIILVIYYIFSPQVGYVWDGDLSGKLLYSFSHANIFHLLGNCFVIWIFKTPIRIEAFVIAVLCAFLPCFATQPTMGASGVLFAHIGMCWAQNGNFKNMCKYILPITILTGLLPGVNLMIHLYCLFLGYLYNFLISKQYAK